MSFKIKLIDNHAIHQIPQCASRTARLLVDTGADLNLIKLNVLHDEVQVSDTKIYLLQSINDLTVKIITMLSVTNGDQTSESEFHVVPVNFPIIGDSIFGKPF